MKEKPYEHITPRGDNILKSLTTPGEITPGGCMPYPKDDPCEFDQVELSLFLIFLLKSRITIIENIIEQQRLPVFKASLTVDYSFCTASEGVVYD